MLSIHCEYVLIFLQCLSYHYYHYFAENYCYSHFNTNILAFLVHLEKLWCLSFQLELYSNYMYKFLHWKERIGICWGFETWTRSNGRDPSAKGFTFKLIQTNIKKRKKKNTALFFQPCWPSKYRFGVCSGFCRLFMANYTIFYLVIISRSWKYRYHWIRQF